MPQRCCLFRPFAKNGKSIWPDAICVLFIVHHSLTTILGVPMILFYRDNKSLHWLCFNLQFAAALALGVGEYLKHLDISKQSNLRQFKILNCFAMVAMIWTRGIHWTYLCIDLYITWYREQDNGRQCKGSASAFFQCCIDDVFNAAFIIGSVTYFAFSSIKAGAYVEFIPSW